jgi:protein involved in polysaccharide export with SLBB domain
MAMPSFKHAALVALASLWLAPQALAAMPPAGPPVIAPVYSNDYRIGAYDKLDIDVFMKNPKVSVQVKEAQSENVTVDGAVTSPGVYPLSGRVTLMQAVAMAKGADSVEANLHKVTLFRTVDGHWTHTQYDLAKIRHGEADDPVIQGRDVVVIASSKKPGFLRAASAILPFVLLLPAL